MDEITAESRLKTRTQKRAMKVALFFIACTKITN